MPKSPEARLAERLQIRGNRSSASVRYTEASSARLGALVDHTDAPVSLAVAPTIAPNKGRKAEWGRVTALAQSGHSESPRGTR